MSKLNKLYTDVYKKIKLEHTDIIKTQEIGVLYTIILILFDEYSPGSKITKATVVCDKLSISKSSDLKKDYEIIIDLLSPIFLDESVGLSNVFETIIGIKKNFETRFLQFTSIFNKDKVMEWLVITACILVGSYVCFKYLERKNNISLGRNDPRTSHKDGIASKNKTTSIIENVKFEKAFLYLVVPALSASNYINKETLSLSSLEALIDSASYFLCTTFNSNKFSDGSLNMTGDPIPLEGHREVIIKIKIFANLDVTNSATRYELKEYLQASGNSTYPILLKACLKDLTGLDTFVRI